MMSATVMVRMRKDTHQILRGLAEQAHTSLQDALARAVESYRKTRFFAEMNAAFERLRSDPEAWAQEL